MKILILLLSISFSLQSQTIISGKVVDHKGQIISGANIYLEGTYDGATSNELGIFSFETSEIGVNKLVISFLSYETKIITADVIKLNNLSIQLRDDVSTLDTVVISAGTFEANDNSKVSVLNSLDVVTTASALGDVLGALQTLPGTSTVSEDGRLFVRGGSADETQIFIDGIRVFTPYTPTTNNAPTRGRYSPFLFDGITFSTGGYSAEYGQALSSVLLLNTIDEPDQDKTDIGLMTVGATVGNTQKWNSSSLSVNVSYINLSPYLEVFKDRNDWKSPFESAQGESVFRKKFGTGLFKFYAAFDTTNFELTQEDINNPDGFQFKLKNKNLFANTSYHGTLGSGWALSTGLSYTISDSNFGFDNATISDKENSVHLKLKLKKRFSSRIKLNFGSDYFMTDFTEKYRDLNTNAQYGFDNNILAVYAESDIIFSRSLALKAGIRADYSRIFKSMEIAPRVSLAYKTSKNSELSLAYGQFYQNPSSEILKFNANLKPQSTSHYILNYQYVNDGKIFRAEGYKKEYSNLVKFSGDFPNFESVYSSNGDGFAQGIDLFWRDNSSIKNVDYWLSYSYLDTKRNHRNFENSITPNFANKHNISVVGKYWVEDLKSQLGLSYTFGSGRPYDNPNSDLFMAERTKSFNSLSLNWAYLISQQKILYFSVNNVLGFKNINGYQYANTPDMNGTFNRRALVPAADQFFFVGFFWTISEKGADNQLNNL